MKQSFFYEVRYLPESQDIYILERVTKDGYRQPVHYEQDSKNWLTLLSNQKSFRFDGKNGNCSILSEQRKDKDGTIRGKKPYWAAYRKAHNTQAKKYVGQDISIANLEKAAAGLTDTLKEKLGIDPDDKLHNTRRLQAGSPDKQKIAFLLDQNAKQERKIKQLEAQIQEKDQTIEKLKIQLSKISPFISPNQTEMTAENREPEKPQQPKDQIATEKRRPKRIQQPEN
jgi:uncharacterized coiled-coil protein SlyX